MPEADDRQGVVVEAVTAGYGDRAVLRGLSLSALPGQITGLIGPNGSGKTTLVRVVSRGLRPRAGRVSVGGWDPYALTARRAARLVAVVPQEVTPTFSFTVAEMVLMGRSPYRSPWGGGSPEDFERVRTAMSLADVEELAERTIDRLSAGERQRVLLAQALAQDAPVLLLDEPTSHLDLRHVVETLGLLRRLVVSERRTVLAVFHDLNLASAYCDRIVALRDGTVAADGPPEAVIDAAVLRRVFEVEAVVLAGGPGTRPAVVLAPSG